MATVADNLNRIKNAKQDIKTAIEAKGVIVPADALIDTYASKIDEIQVGGPAPVITELSVVENGVYTVQEGTDGYSPVKVNVPIPTTPIAKLMVKDFPGMSFAFSRWKAIPEALCLDGIVDMDYFFYFNSNLETVPYFDASSIKTLINTFESCRLLRNIPALDFSNVISMYNTFSNCQSLYTLPALNTSNVKTFKETFSNTPLGTIELDVSSATTIDHPFKGCINLSKVKMNGNALKAGELNELFAGLDDLTSVEMPSTFTGSYMNDMFNGCSSLTSFPKLNTENVFEMDGLFYNCAGLTVFPELNYTKVRKMSSTFYGCTGLPERIEGIDWPEASTNQTFSNSSVKHLSFTRLRHPVEIGGLFQGGYNNGFKSTGNAQPIVSIEVQEYTYPEAGGNMSGLFGPIATSIEKIPQIYVSNVTDIQNIQLFCKYEKPFWGSGTWKDVVMEKLTDVGGLINLKIDFTGKGSFKNCPHLNHQSMLNIINGLWDFRGNGDASTTRTISFAQVCLDLLTPEEAALATNKGWILKAE